MRILSLVFVLLIFVLSPVTSAAAQEKTPPPPEMRAGWSLDELLQPEKADKSEAERLGFKVFRILPRETYDGKIEMRGGGAYYSFVPKKGTAPNDLDPYDYVRVPSPVSGSLPLGSSAPGLVFTGRRNSNDSAAGFGFKMEENQMAAPVQIVSPHYYGLGSDLEFQRGKFSVGFAGADYGFLYDLGELPLEAVSAETPAAKFLNSYQPPKEMAEIRAEQAKIFSPRSEYAADGFTYQRTVPAIVGHSYILRSINFNRSDILVALRIYRQDTDGSLIVFWRKLKTFEVPEINRKK
ncbi:MAG TPA: hypothetical protein VGO50_13140 [Pyrinomonadaceae bacterium]|jgi:hypothetical protein|nr:hypothetical protein [Pyrinomonadaceae bacterium]